MKALDEVHSGLEALDKAVRENFNSCRWYQVIRKIRLIGYIEAFILVDALLHSAIAKYNNEDGGLN